MIVYGLEQLISQVPAGATTRPTVHNGIPEGIAQMPVIDFTCSGVDVSFL